MPKIIEADLLDFNCDIIAQQVNCKGVMGAGLALQIRRKYPIVFYRYLTKCNKQKDLLGTIQVINVGKVYVANLFSQWSYGTSERQTDYRALELCLLKLRDCMINHGLKTLALPYGIGCGLAGGDWNIVYNLINKVFQPVEDKLNIIICKKKKKIITSE